MPVARVGVIHNPRSQRNRLAPQSQPEGDFGPVLQRAPATPEELAEVLRGFADQGVDHLVVDGGDGTLREVLSQLPQAYGERLPTLSLIASGNTNLAAADVGAFARSDQALTLLLATLAGSAPSRRSQRTVIEAVWPDGSRPPVCGFFLGSAGYRRGWRMAHSDIHTRGLWHRWAVAATLARAAWQIITGKPDSDWQRGSAMAIAVDGQPSLAGRRFVFIATSLEKLFLGLWPFWDHERGASHPLRWIDIAAPAPRFARALFALLRGQPKPWMRASGAYRSGDARSLRLRLEEELVIDGEAYPPDANGEIELRAGAVYQFHAPA